MIKRRTIDGTRRRSGAGTQGGAVPVEAALILAPLLVLCTLRIATAILTAASLSFLGLGAQPPIPEWGAMLDAGRDYTLQAWWLEIFPGLAIVLCTLAVTSLGRYFQQKLDGGIGA